MDYSRIYQEFIADRRLREGGLAGYTEKHHIKPRSLGGGDEPENLIRLTAGDHFFAHLLLAKAHGGGLWYAVNALVANQHIGERQKDRAFTLRARRYYEQMKIGFAAAHSARMKGRFTGADHPMYGKPCSPIALEKLNARIAAGFNPMSSPEAREKVRAAMLGREMSPEWREKIAASRRGKPLSAATRANMSRAHTGKKLPPETIAKVAAANRGKKRTPEQVEAMRARLTGRRLSPEHVAKLLPHLARCTRMKGKTHSAETKARFAAVCQARRDYVALHGGNMRTVTVEQMRKAGIDI
jgi:hypothetical protein